MPIWPGRAPGAPADLPPEVNVTTAKDGSPAGRPVYRIGNVVTPTITLYKAENERRSGVRPGVVVFPAAVMCVSAIDIEGTEVCDWLTFDWRQLRAAQVPRTEHRTVSKISRRVAGCAAHHGTGS